jgi:phosphopantothenoylcysteine decarboxylase/phosphopantothenate--cysteine ligase
VVVEPAVGRLTGPDSGRGRLPDAEEIHEVVRDLLLRGETAQDLTGRHLVVSAGGTREYLDPVRFLGNRSSGRQGYALARAAVARGAEVTLVSANVALPDPAGVKTLLVESTAQMRDAVLAAAETADAVVMAAAPADFRPTQPAEHKIKKTDEGSAPSIALTQTDDILATLVRRRGPSPTVIVGFAAETGDHEADVLAHARAKLARKGCDLLVVNDVSGGKVFGSADTEAVVLSAEGDVTPVPAGPKTRLAHVVWDQVVARL